MVFCGTCPYLETCSRMNMRCFYHFISSTAGRHISCNLWLEHRYKLRSDTLIGLLTTLVYDWIRPRRQDIYLFSAASLEVQERNPIPELGLQWMSSVVHLVDQVYRFRRRICSGGCLDRIPLNQRARWCRRRRPYQSQKFRRLESRSQ